jgi:hypothetical protein
MSLLFAKQIPDSIDDEIGRCLRSFDAIDRWTAQKHALFGQFELLAKQAGYHCFTGDCRDYYLTRKGQRCLYDVPLKQRGALAKFAGRRIRLVCGGSLNPYSDRIYYASVVDKQRIDRKHILDYEIWGSVVTWPVKVYLSGEEDDWEIDFDFVDPEAQDSISHCADSAGDFIDIADERHMDLTEFVNALKATRLPELQKLAEDIEKAQAEQDSDE